MSDSGDRGREEFLAEAQEIVESFSRNLLVIDANFKRGVSDPGLVNEAFRAVHTLKGLAGLFGVTGLSSLTHHLEDLLDRLRLGRTEISAEVLDILFGAVEASHTILAHPDEAQAPEVMGSVNRVLSAIEEVTEPEASSETNYEIDPGILAVLTEYEEHRLLSNLKSGLRLFKVRAKFDLMTIDKELETLKDRARKLGEVITYLPTGESTSIDVLELDLLLASGEELPVLIGQLGDDSIVVEEVTRSRTRRDETTSAGSLRAAPKSVPLSLSAASSRAPAAEGDSERPLRVREQRMARRAVRVDIRKLDHLMNVVGELAILRGSLARSAETVQTEHDRHLGRELQRMQRTLERRLEDLQNGILEMRMVPLGQVFDRLARGVRQISRDLDKEVRLVITGSDTEIDKLIVEELGDPLLHMLRNAIDHGIESREQRERAQKGEVGTIVLNAYQKGNHVMIEVEDDGRGVDEDTLLARAQQLGVLSIDGTTELSREEILGLMFLPGLSTRDDVSELSGRGVGMDVVKTNISRIGGVIDVQSEAGVGTKLTLTLPITLAIVRALLVQCESQTYAIPLASVSEVIQLDTKTRKVDGREVMSLRGATLQLCRLRGFFGLSTRPPASAATLRAFVVVAQVGERRLGLVVDAITGQQDIVIKALGRSLDPVRGFAGATELGDQRVGLVLDSGAILDEVFSVAELRRVAQVHG